VKINGQSEVGKIRSILLKHPREAWIDQDNVIAQWRQLNYTEVPEFEKSLEEYDNFVELIGSAVPDIHFLPGDNDDTGLDSIYVHDPVIITERGAILCNMGKAGRKGEPSACRNFFKERGIPILGEINDPGRLEGGDVVWLDEKTLCVGEAYRTNPDGIRQLRELTSGLVDEFIVVPLPHWNGPGDVLHLMSIISPIDYDLAVVYSRLMPVRLREYLIERAIKLIDVPDKEFDSMACNVLALEPRKVIMLEGNPITRRKLENEGVKVLEYKGDEISRKGAGGPTCLTRPLLRSME
jgi:N-dimethylarginine dimethylaminohydrolase